MKRVLRIAAKTAAGVVALAVLVLAAAWGAANTDRGQRWLAGQLEAALSAPDAPASVRGLHGSFPQDLRLDRLELADGDGVWLTVTDARLAWRPLGLLSGRLAVATVRAETVNLARLPASERPDTPPEPAGEINMPRLPLSVRVDTLEVGRLDLGEPVLGQTASFTIGGEAAAPKGAALASRLRVERLDAPGGTLTAEASYQPGRRALDLDAELRGEKGGLAASTLGLPPDAEVRVRLSGDGPLTEWRGALTARLGETARAELDLALDDLDRLTVQGPVEPGALAPEPVPALLGGPVDVSLALARAGDLGVRLDGSTLATPTSRLALDGVVDAGAGTLDLRGEAALPDPGPVNALIAPATLREARATLTAKGPLAAPELTVTADAAAVATPDGGVEGLRAEVSYAPDADPMRGRLSGTVTAERVIPPDDPALAPFAGKPAAAELAGTLDLAANRVDDVTTTLEAADARVRLDGAADLAAGIADAAVEAAVAKLARFTEALGFPVDGTAKLQGHLRAGGDTPVSGTLTGTLTGATWPEASLRALLGPEVALAGNIAMTADGGTRLDGLLVEGANATARGAAALDASGGLDGELALTVPDMTVLSEPLGVDLTGDGTLEAALTGTLDAPTASLDLTATNAAIAGTPLGQLTAQATLPNPANELTAELELAADATPAGPVTVDTTIALTDPGLRLTGTRIGADGITATSEALAVAFDSGALDGTVTAEIDGLGPMASRFGLRARGSGTVTARLTPGSQNLTLDGEIRGLALPEQDIRAQRAKLAAELDTVFADPRGRVRLDLTNARSGGATLTAAALTATGSPAEAEIDLTAEGEAVGPFALKAGATLRREGAARAVELTRLDGRVQDVEVALERPATLRTGPEGLRVQNLALAVGGGTLALDLTQTAERIDARATVAKLPLDLARLVMPQPRLSGALDAELTLSGPLANPTGRLSLNGENIQLPEADLPAMSLAVTSEVGADAVTMEAKLSGLSEQPFVASARLPMRLSLAPVTLAAKPDAPIDGELTWSGDMAPLMPFVPVSGHALAGRGEVEARLGGTFAAPEIGGHATLTDATYENLTTGTLLRKLNLRVEGTGEEIRVTELRAKAGKGTVSGSGRVSFRDAGADAVSIQITADNATLVRRDELTARGDAELTVEGSLTDMLLSGTLTVARANALIPKRLPPSVRALEVTREIGGSNTGAGAGAQPKADADERSKADGETAPPMRIGLDVTVTIPNRLFVRGNGLETEWQGELNVTGTADEPIVRGQISTVRGQVSLLNRVFTIQEGVVSFDGGRDIDPGLNVRADASGEDITATVVVTGSASDPEIELQSTPPLPQDAILSRLLFGKDPADLGALEAAQLGTALAQLTGGGLAGGGFMERVRNLIGVDVLRLGGADGETAVSAGTYLSRDVFVGVEQGTTTESGKVRMELGVTDNISVESNVDATGETDVGIQFKWDY
ncbi:autotransporter secretion inner membrane protein TamB [Limimonas halophila]|uniref:Autotransporter secretion inner membrane protein TamB n=1 Tax=Limimonas halophila TaxID=1082479 RepID=A0A1G7UY41_9PROT|nr:translocation/assembly module TamB domain-containing protein [Limimonas halophila]SDG52427.1 autotransporter secretion inner membrane protein TamB [Limimonas halophila]